MTSLNNSDGLHKFVEEAADGSEVAGTTDQTEEDKLANRLPSIVIARFTADLNAISTLQVITAAIGLIAVFLMVPPREVPTSVSPLSRLWAASLFLLAAGLAGIVSPIFLADQTCAFS